MRGAFCPTVDHGVPILLAQENGLATAMATVRMNVISRPYAASSCGAYCVAIRVISCCAFLIVPAAVSRIR
jgi:hypothetical protein